MWNTIMDMQLFFYGLIGIGAAAVLGMLAMSRFSEKSIRDTEGCEAYRKRLKLYARATTLLCLVVTGVGVFAVLYLRYPGAALYRCLLAGGGSILAIYLSDRALMHLARDAMIGGYLLEFLQTVTEKEKRRESQSLSRKMKPPIRENQTAATREDKVAPMEKKRPSPGKQESKFAKYLTSEEEEIVREVIKEYMT